MTGLVDGSILTLKVFETNMKLIDLVLEKKEEYVWLPAVAYENGEDGDLGAIKLNYQDVYSIADELAIGLRCFGAEREVVCIAVDSCHFLVPAIMIR